MQNEGIYRLSGNKNDIETVMEKFEASKWFHNSSYLIKFSCHFSQNLREYTMWKFCFLLTNVVKF